MLNEPTVAYRKKLLSFLLPTCSCFSYSIAQHFALRSVTTLAVTDLECLQAFFHEHHVNICERVMKQQETQLSLTKCEDWGIEIERRVRHRRRMPGELARDAGLTAEQEMCMQNS